MEVSGIIRDIKIKGKDVDKYIFLTLELDSNTDLNALNELVLKYLGITIKENTAY